MKLNNLHLLSGKTVVVLSILALISTTVVAFLPSVNADHESIVEPLVPGNNTINFRDTTNVLLQSSTITIDTTTVKAGFATIIVEESDLNLVNSSMQVVLASATSTSSGTVEVMIPLTETSDDSNVFTGQLFFTRGSTSGDQLELGLGDDFTVFYEPETDGVGRFSAELGGVTNEGSVEISDFLISTDTRASRLPPWNLVVHPVALKFTDTIATNITVTMSYANANLTGVFDIRFMEVLYRPTPGSTFFSLTCGKFDNNCKDDSGHELNGEKTITSLIQPKDIGAPAGNPTEGQYALGFRVGSPGGGGGGLVRPGLVVNALAGSGSLIGLFSGGSGGGANPTFGDASLLVLENISEGFGGIISEGDDISLDSTKVVNAGDTVVMRFDLYENQGITNLERFRMFLNFEGENYDASTIDTHITYKRDGEITLVDPHEKIDKVEIEILQVDPWNLIVNVKIIFKNTFNSSILVESWDLDRNSGKKLFPDALQVVEPSILLADAQKEFGPTESILTISEDMTETQLTEIPVWVKSNALWWKQKQIDDSDFMAGIKYLVQKAIIEIDENELSNSPTSSEIPIWIRDIAGMWADYSITDEEFVNAMKWLLSNGILEVQQ